MIIPELVIHLFSFIVSHIVEFSISHFYAFLVDKVNKNVTEDQIEGIKQHNPMEECASRGRKSYSFFFFGGHFLAMREN